VSTCCCGTCGRWFRFPLFVILNTSLIVHYLHFSLHERPISGSGSVDLVIYAAQLSQSFFSCLASSVEEFLDIFSPPPASAAQTHGKEDFSLDESSIHSHSIRGLPAGALASIVLWCDAELAKFGAAFGGTRVLGNLALSPPPRESPQKKGPRVLGQTEETNANKDRDVRIIQRTCIVTQETAISHYIFLSSTGGSPGSISMCWSGISILIRKS
jgi:hypothetical protein